MGPLEGLKILEIAGIGPGPFAAMMLSDMGAEVLRIDRAANVSSGRTPPPDMLNRNRRNVAATLPQLATWCRNNLAATSPRHATLSMGSRAEKCLPRHVDKFLRRSSKDF